MWKNERREKRQTLMPRTHSLGKTRGRKDTNVRKEGTKKKKKI